MSELLHQGKISFVNHEKHYATIDYKQDDKKKAISFKIDDPKLLNGVKAGPSKSHYFRVGDEVNFTVALTARGDKMTAHNVKFLYNTALELLINKAATDNSFIGYLKEADDRLFVKEIDSYLFFPLALSPWEEWPDPKLLNEQILFKLIHTDNAKKLAAELITSHFIPEYKKALYHFNRKEPIEATVKNISPYAIYLDVAGDKVQAKITLDKNSTNPPSKIQPGDKMLVKITYLSKTKIVVERIIDN